MVHHKARMMRRDFLWIAGVGTFGLTSLVRFAGGQSTLRRSTFKEIILRGDTTMIR